MVGVEVEAGVLLGALVGEGMGDGGKAVKVAELAGSNVATGIGIETVWAAGGGAQPAKASNPNSNSPAASTLPTLKFIPA